MTAAPADYLWAFAVPDFAVSLLRDSLVRPASLAVVCFLRLEGLAVLAAAALAYHRLDASWLRFAALFLAPDLSMLAYLAGPSAGAAGYNALHSYVGPLALGAAGVLAGDPLVMSLALVWLAHIGFDRALGYGLKYSSGFQQTHLGPIGRRAA